MEKNYIFERPFISYQKVKGAYVVPLGMAGLGFFFVNTTTAIILIVLSIALFFYYRNNSENQSSLYFNTALKHLSTGNKTLSKEFLKQATLEDRENLDAFLVLGSIYYDEGDYKKAITNLKNGQMEKLENDNLNYVMGDCYFGVEKYDKSLKYLEGLTCSNEILENMRVYLLSKVYFNLARYDECFNMLLKYKVMENQTERMKREFNYFYSISALKTNRKEVGLEILQELIKQDKYYRDIESYGKEYNLI